MPENIELTEMGTASQVEQEGNTQNDGSQQHSKPLGVALTGYRLLTTTLILGIGIPKAILSYRGQSMISPTLDWIGGIIIALLLFWLGAIETERGANYPHFFKVDLAPPIWRFLCRDEVYFWFASLLTLLLAVDSMSSRRHIMRQLPGDASGEFWVQPDDYSPTLLVLAICVAVLTFCLHSSHVLWPSRLKSHDLQIRFFISAIFAIINLLSLLILVGIAKTDSSESLLVFIITGRLIMWMMPTLFSTVDVMSSLRPGTMLSIIPLFVNATAVSIEACITYWTRKGLLESLESLYSVLLMCYTLVPILKGLSVIIPASWVAWFTNARAARTGHASRDDVGDLARNAATNDPYGLVFSADYL